MGICLLNGNIFNRQIDVSFHSYRTEVLLDAHNRQSLINLYGIFGNSPFEGGRAVYLVCLVSLVCLVLFGLSHVVGLSGWKGLLCLVTDRTGKIHQTDQRD